MLVSDMIRRICRNPYTSWFTLAILLSPAAIASPQQNSPDEFAQSIRPVLAQNCSACHNPDNPKNRIAFLKAATAKDMEANRALWRDVAAQLRNRTMPPVETKLTEDDRLRVSAWIDDRLRKTACDVGEYAGAVAERRLNRREYHNTIRDLLGVDFNVSEIFPADGTGGAGFDTNGETLFVPPLLMERYLEAAQQIVDRAIVTPALQKTLPADALLPAPAKAAHWRVVPGQEVSGLVSIYLDGDYDVRVALERRDGMGRSCLEDRWRGAVTLVAQQGGRGGGGADARAGPAAHRSRAGAAGARSAYALPRRAERAGIDRKSDGGTEALPPSPEKLALHYRLLGVEPGEQLLQPRKSAERILRTFLRKAYRRPVRPGDLPPLLALYDRAAQRGDPFEERMKLAMKGALVWPDFLFKMEERKDKPGIYPRRGV